MYHTHKQTKPNFKMPVLLAVLISSLIIILQTTNVSAFLPSNLLNAKVNNYNINSFRPSYYYYTYYTYYKCFYESTITDTHIVGFTATRTTTPSSCSRRNNNRIINLFAHDEEDGDKSHDADDNEDNEDNNNNNNDDDFFMSSLQSRIQKLQEKETKMPIIVLDAMLPRQTLKLEIRNKLLQKLIQHRVVVNENPTLGMLGKAILENGDVINLNKGVEVEIQIDKHNFVQFKGGRRFRLDGEIESTTQGWTEGRITYLSSKEEEENEIQQNKGAEDPVRSLSNAISKAKLLTSPNMSLPNNVSLIERWIELAKENEREPGQINKLIEELGDMPDESEPSEIAFWIGSMINPLPAMGVAMEIRPALLMSESAEERVQIAFDGLIRSIKHMDGSARMW